MAVFHIYALCISYRALLTQHDLKDMAHLGSRQNWGHRRHTSLDLGRQHSLVPHGPTKGRHFELYYFIRDDLSLDLENSLIASK